MFYCLITWFIFYGYYLYYGVGVSDFVSICRRKVSFRDVWFVFTSSCLREGSCLIYVICVCLVCLYLQLFQGGIMSYLRYLCLFVHSGVQHILCYVWFFFVLLPVSLDCQFFIVTSVFSNIYFTITSSILKDPSEILARLSLAQNKCLNWFLGFKPYPFLYKRHKDAKNVFQHFRLDLLWVIYLKIVFPTQLHLFIFWTKTHFFLRHDMAEILLKLALNSNQSIISFDQFL